MIYEERAIVRDQRSADLVRTREDTNVLAVNGYARHLRLDRTGNAAGARQLDCPHIGHCRGPDGDRRTVRADVPIAVKGQIVVPRGQPMDDKVRPRHVRDVHFVGIC